MIRAALTRYNLSRGAVVAQNLIELHGRGTSVQPIAGQLANRLVQKVYHELPNVFDGKRGKRPHKLSTAAAALAWGVKFMGEHPEEQLAMHLGLGTVLLELSGKPYQYALSGNDHLLIGKSEEIYLSFTAGELANAGKRPEVDQSDLKLRNDDLRSKIAIALSRDDQGEKARQSR